MNAYHVEPLVGVGSVRLGMHRDEVHSLMGAPASFKKVSTDTYETEAFHENAFQVFYAGDEATVEYIELSSGGNFIASYRGVDVFNTKAEDLVALISQEAPVDESDEELGYSYIFPQLELSVWRPVMPESEDDLEGQYFSTIGVGVRGYYSGRDS